MNEIKLKPCPFCGGEARLQLMDEECNWRDEAYLENPYSGITYGIVHDVTMSKGECPIESNEIQGNWCYDTKEEAINAWNIRTDTEIKINIIDEMKEGVSE